MPIIGDDIKSQVGATITHRVLTSLFRERGVHLDKTMQLNVGGNSDFLNMLERERLESKKISKTNAVTSMLDYDLGDEERARRPVRLRAVADRPQVGVHPPRGVELRRRAAERRAEARGVGLAELGRHRDRRRPAREARPEQRHRRLARRPELLPDEVAAAADPGRRRRTSSSRSSSSGTAATAARSPRLRPRRSRAELAGGPPRAASPLRVLAYLLETRFADHAEREVVDRGVTRRERREAEAVLDRREDRRRVVLGRCRRRTRCFRYGAMMSAGMRVPGPELVVRPVVVALARRRDVIPLSAELVVGDDHHRVLGTTARSRSTCRTLTSLSLAVRRARVARMLVLLADRLPEARPASACSRCPASTTPRSG